MCIFVIRDMKNYVVGGVFTLNDIIFKILALLMARVSSTSYNEVSGSEFQIKA